MPTNSSLAHPDREAIPSGMALPDAEGGGCAFSSLNVITANPYQICLHEGAGEASLVNVRNFGPGLEWLSMGDGSEVQVSVDGEVIRSRRALSDEEKRLRNKLSNDSRARARLRRYFKKNLLGKMWTLTFAEATFDRSYVVRMVNEFLVRWRKANGGVDFPYAYVLELHPGGHGWHVHLATRSGFVSWWALGRLWGHGFVQFEDRKHRANEGGRERSRRLANYLCKYLEKSVGDDAERESGQHRYEVGQGFEPEKIRRAFATEKEARAFLAAYVGESFVQVWSSDERDEWDGPPTWLFFSG